MSDDTPVPPLTGPQKAIGAFFVSGLGALAIAAADNGITLGEGLGALAVAAAAAGAVYGITNKPKV